MVAQDSIQKYSRLLSLLLILCSILLSYSNTFKASWHFDDIDNILTNQALHISDLNPESLIKTFFANPIFPNKKLFYRPISNFTFALNWYWGGEVVWGYHLVNIIIHLITAVFLYFSILRLYGTPLFSDTDKLLVVKIALFATLLWALNPIQTQAVTYIVQRMASLAAMFYIMGIYFYLRLRQTFSLKNRLLSCICMLFCALFAIGSKENAATFPFSLILIELFFFKRYQIHNNRQKSLLAFIGIGFALIVSLFFLNGNPLSFLEGYGPRSFSLIERLLTEPRILVIYLSQLFYPATFRLSLEHDIILSKSFLTPWTTIPALVFIFFLISYATVSYKKYPIISFSILFYFLNHLIESTIIPLELVYEHRNYLPSLFLFVPFADFLMRKTASFQRVEPTLYRTLTIFCISLPITIGTGTYIRNMSWVSEESLWMDTINKAPASARASYNLGNVYMKAGLTNEALILFTKAKDLAYTAPTPKNVEKWALNGIGSVYLLTDRQEQAVTFFEQTLSIDPKYNIARFNLTLALFALRQLDEAKQHLKVLLNSYSNNTDYLLMDELLKLTSNKPIISRSDSRKLTISPEPTNTNLFLLLAIAYKNHNQYSESLEYLKKYNQLFPDQLRTKIAMTEIYHIQNKFDDKDHLVKEILINFTQQEINEALANNSIMRMQLFHTEKMRNILNHFH